MWQVASPITTLPRAGRRRHADRGTGRIAVRLWKRKPAHRRTVPGVSRKGSGTIAECVVEGAAARDMQRLPCGGCARKAGRSHPNGRTRRRVRPSTGASLPRSACTGEIRPRDRRNCGRVESNHPDFRGLSRDAAAIEDGAGSEDDGKPIAMRRKQSTTSWLRIGQAPALRTVRALDLPGRARLTSFRSGAGSPRTMIPAMPGESHERGRFIGHARLQW
jgi:hypothetical protein